MSLFSQPKTDVNNELLAAILAKDKSKIEQTILTILQLQQLALPGFEIPTEDQERQLLQVSKNAAGKIGVPLNLVVSAFGRHPLINDLIFAFITPNPQKSLEQLEPITYLPIRPANAIRFNTPEEAWDKTHGGIWLVEPKLDGWYCQVHLGTSSAKAFKKGGGEFDFLSTITKDSFELFRGHQVIIEGELIPFDSDGKPGPRTELLNPDFSVYLNIFDILYYDTDLTRVYFNLRRERLEKLFPPTMEYKHLRLTPQKLIDNRDEFVKQFHYWNDQIGMEGMMAKRGDAIYSANLRTLNLIKIKSKDTIDAVILGYTKIPRSYLLGLWDEDDYQFVPFVWVTPQKEIIADEQILEPMDPSFPPFVAGGRKTQVRINPKIVVEVKGDKISPTKEFICGKKQTGTGWTIFSATISQIRTDKTSNEVTTVGEFLELHKMAGY